MKCANCGEDMQYIPRSGSPGWAIALAILFFPIGLVCLAVKKKSYFQCFKCGYKQEQ